MEPASVECFCRYLCRNGLLGWGVERPSCRAALNSQFDGFIEPIWLLRCTWSVQRKLDPQRPWRIFLCGNKRKPDFRSCGNLFLAVDTNLLAVDAKFLRQPRALRAVDGQGETRYVAQ
jgi:hypothetical protein